MGYWHDNTSYVVDPAGSLTLHLPVGCRHCFMEYERRATTPRRVRDRLENYRRYFRSGYDRRDHGGEPPLVQFVFETPDDEDAFMDAASYVDHAPSPAPTWRPSPNAASWLTRNCRPPRTPGKGCHCRDWSRCHFFGKAAPGVSYKGGSIQ